MNWIFLVLQLSPLEATLIALGQNKGNTSSGYYSYYYSISIQGSGH